MIILNTIFVGVDAELSPHKADYWALFQFMRILELFSIAVFLMDIGIKWIDNFAQYWEDGWNLVIRYSPTLT